MKKFFFFLFMVLLFSSSPTFAAAVAEAASPAASSNAAYYRVLIDLSFNIILTLALLAGLVATFWLGVSTLRTVVNPTLMQQLGDKPMTIGRALGGLALVSVLYGPLDAMAIFADFTGVGSSGICLTVNVDVAHIDWTNNAAACIKDAESKFAQLAEYTNKEHIESANIGLLFGVVQLISLGFFLSSTWMLFLHMIGARDVKLSKGAAIFAMLVSTVLISAPVLVSYIEDFRGQQNVIIET